MTCRSIDLSCVCLQAGLVYMPETCCPFGLLGAESWKAEVGEGELFFWDLQGKKKVLQDLSSKGAKQFV